MPVRASEGRESVGQGTKPQDQAAEVGQFREEIEGAKAKIVVRHEQGLIPLSHTYTPEKHATPQILSTKEE
ncbi:hypothetical protein EYF80_028441 [Liparis tanakae]|uniref:Uncharacterized protein n=1 Tax=Liparis tanakae TaxID=230148 RepID=A0A4Z2H8X4_9TELE|nr:hypothetical protein EYF80_028441 [Liparis tanakae]